VKRFVRRPSHEQGAGKGLIIGVIFDLFSGKQGRENITSDIPRANNRRSA
jgi:hypothetical protein